MGDTVIFANVCPPENLPLSKSLGVQPQTLPPNVTPGFCFKIKTGKKTVPPTKTKSTEKSMSQPETNASLDSLDVLDHPPHRF